VTIDEDRWELYDLRNDFSEHDDLADAHPDKVAELVERWWAEAERFQVLPLDERAGGGGRPRRPVARRFTLWPGLERVPSDAAPRLVNTSHRLSAHITVPAGGCEGAIIAEGDRWGGWVMFVQDGVPCFHYHFPLERHELRGADPLAPGDHVVTWTLTKVDRFGGRGELAVDGENVATADIPRILRGWMPFNGLDVGCNNGAPVGTSYESPFRFTGELHRVEVELLDEQPGPHPAIEHRSEMGKQ
jgi:arylsulfatase